MLRLFGSAAALVLLGVACGDGGGASVATPTLAYNGSMPFPAVIGEAIVLTPLASGTLGQYRVSPALPAGLSIDEQSGVIAGTPRTASGPETFVVSAAGAGIHVTYHLVLSVTEPPHGLYYTSPVTATVRVALAPLRPSISGTADHYAVSPTLPRGILLDSSSGILSGTPTEASGIAPYTVTANSLAGNTRFILLLTVKRPPSGGIPRHGPARGSSGRGRGQVKPLPSQNRLAIVLTPS
jgi:hypothetical protein